MSDDRRPPFEGLDYQGEFDPPTDLPPWAKWVLGITGVLAALSAAIYVLGV